MRIRPALVLLLASSTACESGTSEFHVIAVSDPVATQYSATAPGLLRTEGGYEIVAVLCGERLAESAELSIDHGFGCLDDELKGEPEARVAWVEPMPATWDPDALCAMPPSDPAWQGTQPGEEVTGSEASFASALAVEPDPGWPQGQGQGVWKRDVSPCGGSLRVEIAIDA